MAKPSAQDLRERRVRAGRAGQSRDAAARSFDVSASCGCPLPHPDRKFSRLRLSASRGFK
jgi:hypothetical protein